ncbi:MULTISPECIES: hypothetical protein [unclassified Tolypothrix]|uniref:hypothetical protein n=1 Tax=unclassified Tolypothrix TaxID=2649714 RepID=UPI0005EAA3FC|nr:MULTISPECIES: hypothetical protein [unclassified Tolypothrix]BAY93181.1 hypothetical protein NIES3275_52190 [Microchaete diplosiphon NIES-3275]EKF00247.1 hypothetical protein FDUTEX481_09113 [Tolypothrix sp. PCC 7601]MBE9082941.1 hypothetical protein [Tolypothrix sp. LEGE 11397]UYD27056.1 hypothetical protein HGR01_02805 [Tolypothrix sp. PCC 7712]UYD37086.1 hypothetical protein HG267_15970 [Tolypothrix sp. PCC 7601]
MLKGISLAITLSFISFINYSHSQAIATTTTDYQIAQNSQPSTALTEEQLGIGGIKLSMREIQVRKILGKPVKVENIDSPAIGRIRTLKYPDITVDLDEGGTPGKFTVYQIKVTSNKYATIDGVKVGDGQSKVIRTYGKAEIYKEDNLTRINYGLENPSPAGLNFTFKNGKVIEILCFYVMN